MSEARAARWTVAVDVKNPLLGPQGAAAVFGPQKGASPHQVHQLEEGLKRLVACLEEVADLPREGQKAQRTTLARRVGGGAGGGMALALVAVCDARIEPGGPVVARAVELDAKMEGADLVVTGEGCLDDQTVMGKAPAVVARWAQKKNIPVVAVAGRLGPGVKRIREVGIVDWLAASPRKVPLADEAAALLREATTHLVARYLRNAKGEP
jgi:glycerate kinase